MQLCQSLKLVASTSFYQGKRSTVVLPLGYAVPRPSPIFPLLAVQANYVNVGGTQTTWLTRTHYNNNKKVDFVAN